MRKILLPITLFMLAGLPSVYGQISYTLGLKAGLSVSNQSYRFTPIDYKIKTTAQSGPVVSLFVETLRREHFSIQVDISYVVKGSGSTLQSVTVNHLDHDRISITEGEAASSAFHYLSLAPMARYRMGQGLLQPYFLLGPRVDMLLHYSSESEYPLPVQNHAILGLTGGAGLEYKLQKLGLFAELQFQPDLSPLTSLDPLLIRNNMISLTLGIRLFSPG